MDKNLRNFSINYVLKTLFILMLLITCVAFVAYTASTPESSARLRQLFRHKDNTSRTVRLGVPDTNVSTVYFPKPPEVPFFRLKPHGSFENTQNNTTNLRQHFKNMASVCNMILPTSVRSRIPEADCNTNRFLVYKCTSMCGGMGDRQKGITSAFLLALLTNRTFVIDMPSPCDISQFLQSNVYDWQKCRHKVKMKEIKVHRYMNSATDFKKMIPNTNFDKLWTDEVIYIQTNVYIVEALRSHRLAIERIPWLNNITREEILGYILAVLFRVKYNISDRAFEFAQNYVKGKQLICAHIRYGRNPSIPNDAKRDKSFPNVPKIVTFLKSYEDEIKYTVYVASDSENVRDTCRKKIRNVVTSNQTIFHIDRSRISSQKAACDGFNSVIFEQLILSRCDVLLLTRSNFGAMAAYQRGSSENLFLYDRKSDSIIPVNLSDIQKIYSFN